MSAADKIVEARALIEPLTGHTEAPWMWAGYPDDLKLCTVERGRQFVMDFVRYGMRAAQPRFQIRGSMVKAVDRLIQFEVGDSSVRGTDEAKTNTSVYRWDVRGIDHPDARLIAAAPALRDTVAALADLADAQAQENANLTAENADLKTSVIAFCGVHAVTYAKQWGLPDGHLHPHHYDILEKAGARMVDFTRAALGDAP